MKPILTWSQVAAFRLARHHLHDQKQSANATSPDLATICRDVCGIQAQLMRASEIALWTRKHDIARPDINSALWDNGTLVKTSCMRQTLHLIAASDFSLYISSLKRSRVAALRRILSKYGHGISPKETEALNNSILEALRDGPMTQRKLTEQIIHKASRKIRAFMELAWSIQLFRLALVEGLICYGPDQGSKATFVRVDQWLPEHKEVPELEAKQILLRRYLHAYGPARLQDFSKWSGISINEAREVWESLKQELVEVHVEDEQGFILPEDLEELTDSRLDDQTLRLLPHFDVYLLGHSNKNHLISVANYKRVYRSQGWITPVVLLNGTIFGLWSYSRVGKQWTLSVEPFEKISRVVREKIEEEALSLGDFLNLRLEIRFGDHVNTQKVQRIETTQLMRSKKQKEKSKQKTAK